MNYVVFCTFEIKNGSQQDYVNVYADLEKIGLRRVISTNGTNFVLPTSSVMGTFTGATGASVREDVRPLVINSFRTRKLKAEIFIVVGGGDAVWSTITT